MDLFWFWFPFSFLLLLQSICRCQMTTNVGSVAWLMPGWPFDFFFILSLVIPGYLCLKNTEKNSKLYQTQECQNATGKHLLETCKLNNVRNTNGRPEGPLWYW